MKGQVTMELEDYTNLVQELTSATIEVENLENRLISQVKSTEKMLISIAKRNENYFEYGVTHDKFKIRQYYEREVRELGVNDEQLEFILDWLLQDKRERDKAAAEDDES